MFSEQLTSFINETFFFFKKSWNQTMGKSVSLKCLHETKKLWPHAINVERNCFILRIETVTTWEHRELMFSRLLVNFMWRRCDVSEEAAWRQLVNFISSFHPSKAPIEMRRETEATRNWKHSTKHGRSHNNQAIMSTLKCFSALCSNRCAFSIIYVRSGPQTLVLY